jgi:hypothetical protein
MKMIGSDLIIFTKLVNEHETETFG